MYKNTFFILLFFFIFSSIFAKAGPKIPTPGISIEKAIAISKERIKKEKKAVDTSTFKLKEYFITSIEYTKSYNKKKLKKWSWVIVFTHPIANDHKIIYRVFENNKIELLGVTE